MSHELLKFTSNVIGQIDTRVLPPSVAVQLEACKKLINEELAPKEPAPVAKPKPAKKKDAKKKVAKKK